MDVLPPFSRQRIFLVRSPALQRSSNARHTVARESFSSRAMVLIDGQQVPSLLVRSLRYIYTATARWGRSAAYIELKYPITLPSCTQRRSILIRFAKRLPGSGLLRCSLGGKAHIGWRILLQNRRFQLLAVCIVDHGNQYCKKGAKEIK